MMGKYILRNGLISGCIMVAFFLFTFKSGINDKISYRAAELMGYIGMIVSLMTIVLAILQYKRDNNGITFGKALGLGLGISVIAGLMFGVFTVLLYTVISPGLGDELVLKYLEQMEQNGATPEALATAKEQMMAMQSGLMGNPLFQGALMAVTVVLVGLVVSLINAMVFSFSGRRKA